MEIKKTETEIYVAKDGEEFKNKNDCERYEERLGNLLEETLEELENNNKNESDVLFVGFQMEDGCLVDYYTGKKHRISWEKFKQLAKNYWYDSGYGCNEVSLSLVIVGDDWWLEREEYDGSEWWEFKQKPNIDDYEFTDKIENIKL